MLARTRWPGYSAIYGKESSGGLGGGEGAEQIGEGRRFKFRLELCSPGGSVVVFDGMSCCSRELNHSTVKPANMNSGVLGSLSSSRTMPIRPLHDSCCRLMGVMKCYQQDSSSSENFCDCSGDSATRRPLQGSWPARLMFKDVRYTWRFLSAYRGCCWACWA